RQPPGTADCARRAGRHAPRGSGGRSSAVHRSLVGEHEMPAAPAGRPVRDEARPDPRRRIHRTADAAGAAEEVTGKTRDRPAPAHTAGLAAAPVPPLGSALLTA